MKKKIPFKSAQNYVILGSKMIENVRVLFRQKKKHFIFPNLDSTRQKKNNIHQFENGQNQISHPYIIFQEKKRCSGKNKKNIRACDYHLSVRGGHYQVPKTYIHPK